MLELWINGRLSGYWSTPAGFRNAREYASYYNYQRETMYDACGDTVRLIAI